MKFQHSADRITANMLEGFFVDWPNPPNRDKHLKLLKNSSHVIIALDEDSNEVIGFIPAISDGVLCAYIPLLEVLPAYQRKGIGKELVEGMLKELKDFYMIDLCCDDDLVAYYESFGMMQANGMLFRNYANQSGKKVDG